MGWATGLLATLVIAGCGSNSSRLVKRAVSNAVSGARTTTVTLPAETTTVTTPAPANEQIESDPATAARLASRLERETEAALQELRALVEGLEPPVLTDFGLVHALRSVSRAFPVRVSFVMRGVGPH